MVVHIDYGLNDPRFDEKLISVLNTFNKYIDYRFDYVIRTSINHIPPDLEFNIDISKFDPSEEILLACINSNDTEHNVDKIQSELKKLTSEVDAKTKEFNIVSLNEDGLRNNIQHLKDIIKIKQEFIQETASFAEIRHNAKEKVQVEYNEVNKKYHKIKHQMEKSSKTYKNSGKFTEYGERLNEKALQYEAKIKKMDEVIKIASDSKEKLHQYQLALVTSKDRLKIFRDQLNNTIKSKQELLALLTEKNKRIKHLKMNLSNLGVLSSIERSRVNTSSNIIENDDLKKEFIELREMRDDILSLRPKGMFNPKYQKKNNLTKEDVRKYLENDEAINSIDYLIELKNYEAHNNETDILQHMQLNTNEKSIFTKCLSTLGIDEVKKLLVHYFIKVVDLKESSLESDDLIAKLDEISDRQKHTIITLNNNYQQFHLSIEKKYASLKKYYQDKLHKLLQHIQEENNAVTMFKMRQEISNLKKKLAELEKELDKEKEKLAKMAKLKEPIKPETSHLSSERLDASKSGSETVSSAKVTYHKNKLRIQKIKSKLNI